MQSKYWKSTLAIIAAAWLTLGLPTTAQGTTEPTTTEPLIDRSLLEGLTRGELAELYESMVGDTPPPDCVEGDEMFDDVPASHPFCPWIEELARQGITGGCDGSNFCPGDPVSRAQMAAFVVRSLRAGPAITVATATDNRTIFSTDWEAIPGSSVQFRQASEGPVIVRFSGEVSNGIGHEILVRARIPGVGVAQPGTEAFGVVLLRRAIENQQGALRQRTVELVFPSVPAGNHEVLIEWRNSNPGGASGVRNRTTVVHHNKPHVTLFGG